MAHSDNTDLQLLRQYEPILRFNQGEVFFPTDVARYVEACSLWISHADGREEQLFPEGEVTLERLAEPRQLEFGDVLYLRFVDELSLSEITRQVLRGERMVARALDRGWNPGQGRLARVGYFSRLVDALFSLALLARGKVPGATEAVAERKSARIQALDERFVYYGRVFRDSGWIGLQYWFFYHYGDWRTGFNGVNDHEGDWETVFVYLYEKLDGSLAPRWAVYSCHDFQGDDLRRRWDDLTELKLIGDHPVVFVGAGSHAAYFHLGEYLIEAEIPLLDRLTQAWDRLMRIWYQLIQGRSERQREGISLLTIPFVEFARGDGKSIGPGQGAEWEPVLLDPLPGWLTSYRGLWGLYGRGSITGEIAPGGPMYYRDGTPRLSWYDPLAYAGLDTTPTPPIELDQLKDRQRELTERQAEVIDLIRLKMDRLFKFSVEHKALADFPGLTNEAVRLRREIKQLEDEVNSLRREQSQNQAKWVALDLRIYRLRSGQEDPPQAHIKILQSPDTPETLRFGGLAEFWAAMSIGLVLLIFVTFLAFIPQRIPLGITILVTAFVFIEAFFRGRLRETSAWIANTLAFVVAILLLVSYFKEIVIGLLLAGGLFLTWDNLRELKQTRPRRIRARPK